MRRILAALAFVAFGLPCSDVQAGDTEAQAAMRKAIKATVISVSWKDTLVQDVAKELADKLEEQGKLKDARVKVDSLVTGLTRNMKITLSANNKSVADILDELGNKYSLGYVILGKDDPKGKYKVHKKADGTLLLTKSDERGDVK